MDIREYSEQEVVEIIKEFKSFMKKLICNASIDFSRKNNIVSAREIVYSDLVDKKVSLSLTDDDAFFSIEEDVEFNNIENAMTSPNLKKIIKNLKKEEKEILYFMLQELNNEEISLKLNLSEKTIRNKKSIIRNKIKAKMEEIRNENRNDK